MLTRRETRTKENCELRQRYQSYADIADGKKLLQKTRSTREVWRLAGELFDETLL